MAAVAAKLAGDTVMPFETEKKLRGDDVARCAKGAREIATPIQIGDGSQVHIPARKQSSRAAE